MIFVFYFILGFVKKVRVGLEFLILVEEVRESYWKRKKIELERIVGDLFKRLCFVKEG